MKLSPNESRVAPQTESPVPLESVLRTEELNRRSTRPPDYETENRALISLARALAESPRNILQILADTILEVLRVGSAGVSLLTKDDGGKRFYWPAIAGAWKPNIGGGTPRDFGPCGDVLDRNAPLMFINLDRRYTYFRAVSPSVEEALLVPFYVEGKAVGTIWAVAHDDSRKFDLEDRRQLLSFATFASSGYQAVTSWEKLEQQSGELRQNHAELIQSVLDLRDANAQAKDSRRAALNLMEDAVRTRQEIEAMNIELQAAKMQLADHAGRLERAVVERTAELTAINKQLETLVYSIAHDLRAPLRAMEGFSQVLVEGAGSNLSKTGKDLANRISTSAQFLDAMLRDLLTFSRVCQERMELTTVNLKMIAQKQISLLKAEVEQKNAEIEILGSWDNALGHERTLGHVFCNLLTNALKFAKPGVSPLIRFRAEELTASPLSWVRVWVEDNGIGIEPQHQEQTFRLFTRLHGDQFPGTGFGLAIVQKGIERMGGRVGVESIPGQGSRFWFELRKA